MKRLTSLKQLIVAEGRTSKHSNHQKMSKHVKTYQSFSAQCFRYIHTKSSIMAAAAMFMMVMSSDQRFTRDACCEVPFEFYRFKKFKKFNH